MNYSIEVFSIHSTQVLTEHYYM